MNWRPQYPSREEQAKAEIGVTAISRRAAIVLVALFLLTVVAVPLIDQAMGAWRAWKVLAEGDRIQKRLRDVETTLEEQSTVDRSVRPIVRAAISHAGVSGVEKVYRGGDGWLFYEPDVRYVTGGSFLEDAADTAQAARLRQSQILRQHDPIAAIVDFKNQLAARGVQLVIVPTPVKPSVQPEMMWSGAAGPVENLSFAKFKTDMEARGILIFDVTDQLAAAAKKGSPQYLARDTHWRPEAMELAATDLAQFVSAHVQLPQTLGIEFGRGESQLRGRGDLANMLESKNPDDLEAVTIHPIRQPDGQPWAPHDNAAILWLGDSFSNIYSAGEMGWGQSAGFAEQFSYLAGRPLDALRRNDNGAFASRQMLADELARGNDRLAGKKLVIWQFADRELSQGDWKKIELKLNPRPPQRFLVPPAGQTWIIEAAISEKGAAPRPGNVAYRDHILAIRLIDISIDQHPVPGGEAIVYLRSMIDGKLTPAADLQIGQRVQVKVRDWSEVARRYEFMNRSDLPEIELRSQPACWGELIK
jgi:alginate O-acetyltransferase complex protein AlgJ